MASPSEYFSELTAFTIRHQKRRITDNITAHNALYRAIKKRGNMKTDISGGDEIVEAVILQENNSIQNFSGFQRLNVGEQENGSAVKFPWVQKWMSVVASGDELRKNRGQEGLIKLVNARIEAAEATAANRMNVELYGDGSVAESIGGLQLLIQDNGQGTVGGIDASLWSNWRNQFREMTGTGAWSKSTIRGEFNKLWIDTCFDMEKPDLILCTIDVYNAYEESVQDQFRIMDMKSAETGVETLYYKSAPVTHDVNANFAATDERAFFLNTKHLYLFEHPDARWEKEEARKPVDQDAVVIPFIWMGNMAIKSRRSQGVLIDAA